MGQQRGLAIENQPAGATGHCIHPFSAASSAVEPTFPDGSADCWLLTQSFGLSSSLSNSTSLTCMLLQQQVLIPCRQSTGCLQTCASTAPQLLRRSRTNAATTTATLLLSPVGWLSGRRHFSGRCCRRCRPRPRPRCPPACPETGSAPAAGGRGPPSAAFA